MKCAVQGHDAVRPLAPQPAGPAETAGVVRANTQFAHFFVAQLQPDVVVQRVTQGESHQRAQRLIALANRQKFVKALLVQVADVNAEFAAAVANPFPQHQAVTELVIAQAQGIALLRRDNDPALDALLNRQRRVLEVVTQH